LSRAWLNDTETIIGNLGQKLLKKVEKHSLMPPPCCQKNKPFKAEQKNVPKGRIRLHEKDNAHFSISSFMHGNFRQTPIISTPGTAAPSSSAKKKPYETHQSMCNL